MERRVHLVTVVNGPGEVAGWMLPVVRRLKARSPSAKVTTVITPCQFASGRELDAVAADGRVDHVWSFQEFVRQQVRRRWRGERMALPETIVLHFGGDRLYTRIVARTLGAPIWRHGTSARGWLFADRFLVPDERHVAKLRRQGVEPERVSVVGQLVVDSVLQGQAPRPDDAGGTETAPRVLLLPGSRRWEVRHMLPFLADVIDIVSNERSSTAFVISRASFVESQAFARVATRAGCQMSGDTYQEWLETNRHVRCRIVDGSWIPEAAGATLAVSLPGTNTLQLAALGVPMVVVLPLNWGEHVPFEGVAGLLLPASMPFGLVKRHLTRLMNRWVVHTALPNILASDSVVPEVRGVLRASDVARTVVDLLDDHARRATMTMRLREIAGPPGAADRIVDLLLERRETRCASGC